MSDRYFIRCPSVIPKGAIALQWYPEKPKIKIPHPKMPQYDLYHDEVKNALSKHGWTITDYPYTLSYKTL